MEKKKRIKKKVTVVWDVEIDGRSSRTLLEEVEVESLESLNIYDDFADMDSERFGECVDPPIYDEFNNLELHDYDYDYDDAIEFELDGNCEWIDNHPKFPMPKMKLDD